MPVFLFNHLVIDLHCVERLGECLNISDHSQAVMEEK